MQMKKGFPEASGINSKGSTLRGALVLVEKTCGAGGLDRVLQNVDAESHEILSRVILPSQWYSFRVQVRTYEAIDRAYGKGYLAGMIVSRRVPAIRPM